MVRWVVGSILHGVDPLSYFSFQPVLNDWCRLVTDVFITLQHMMFHMTIISDSELDSVKALFNEKEKELSLAVARVEHLTKQLEEIQNGKLSGINGTTQSAAVAELEKLRKELVVSRSYW